MIRDDDVFGLYNRVRRLLDHACQDLMGQSGLRMVELEILYFLSRSGSGDTARDIIEARNLSKAHISKSVDNLRRTGCVTLKADAEDRRCLHLLLTPRGRGYAADYAGILRRVGAQILEDVTPEERRVIRGAMEKIRRNVEAAADTIRTPRGKLEETP
ncbi:MAG TPA: MarR family winged helix-turn-helix transcriptional regulator [Candidatus Gemmiger faecigallinarum]|nr:MarR family winged helix-turn-helix transcriptional regulator [Candidatus Gemmiger faecigallinarum]